MSTCLDALPVELWDRPFEFDVESTLAAELARRNLARNRAALAEAQPELLAFVPTDPPPGEYVFGRDESLTMRLPDGRWLDDCTVPLRAARRMVETLRIAGMAAVVIAPSHPAHLAAILEHIEPHQAVVVLWPDDTSLHLACCLTDLAEALRSQRLIVATGGLWWSSLRKALEDRPGLPVPVQLVRLGTTPASVMEQLQPDLDQLIAEACNRQQAAIDAASSVRRPMPREARRWLVVGGSHRVLWGDAPAWMESLAACVPDGLSLDRIDSSRAIESSQVRFLRSAAEAHVVLTIDAGRSDQPAPALEAVPWISLASNRIAPARHARPCDRIIVRDVSAARAARAAGWTDRQIIVRSIASVAAITGRSVGVIADVVPPGVPDSVERYSSQRLVWENLVSMLSVGRFAGESPRAMLQKLAEAQQVEVNDLPVHLMAQALTETTLAVWAARVLVRAGIEPVLYGRGWDTHDDLQRFHRGADPARMNAALEECASLVDVWPDRATHASRVCGRRLIPIWGRSEASIINDVRAGELLTRRSESAATMLDWPALQDLALECLKR